jgi:MoaA/NifB/PqqE/SkfB family radical SAM enzyme
MSVATEKEYQRVECSPETRVEPVEEMGSEVHQHAEADAPNLTNLAVMVTHQCNLECYHCFRYSARPRPGIDPEKIKALTKRIATTSLHYARLTGGEPFLSKHLEEMVCCFKDAGLHSSIVTNGTLVDSHRLKALEQCGLDELWFSVHSRNEASHDNLVGRPGAYRKMSRSLQESISIGITTNVYFPVSIKNVWEAEETLKWLDELGVNRIKVLRISPFGKAGDPDFDHLSPTVWQQLVHKTAGVRFSHSTFKIQGSPNSVDENSGACGCTIFPFKHLNVDSSGEIYPCCLLTGRQGYGIGNIDELLACDDTDVLLREFVDRIRTKYVEKGPFPCLGKDEVRRDYSCCPLFSQDPSHGKN